MSGEEVFVDYYSLLQVNPDCDAKILEAAYHHLAKLHHPDHTGKEDSTTFSLVVEAYRILRDPELRANYDELHAQHVGQPVSGTQSAHYVVDEQAVLNDADDHARILNFLYKKRREDAQNAGVIGFYIQDMLQCSDEHFEFHKWYLKEKGYIVLTEQGGLAITIEGVDHVIAMSRNAKVEKLLLGRSNGSASEPADD